MTSITMQRNSGVRAGKRLWIAQGVLAAIFLFAGGSKLAMPAAALAAQSHMPGAFLKFIGFCETAGALGLILPGLFHIQERLTTLAAFGLVIIMIGATVTTLIQGLGAIAILPAAVGLLAGWVVRERSRLGR